jgi:hypothetical protein
MQCYGNDAGIGATCEGLMRETCCVGRVGEETAWMRGGWGIEVLVIIIIIINYYYYTVCKAR